MLFRFVALFTLLLSPLFADAYSVQTHEQLVDLEWKPTIVPLLLARYPGLTSAQLDQAHAYAYGGCAIQDLGYYPFGNALFSDLLHYVRTGDFVRSLLRNAKNPDELAFAIGAMSHYVGDTTGHGFAINPAVGTEFPALAARYGRVVTYEDNPHAHVRTEFAFDINELSKHRFAPSHYLNHVGLLVANDLLARAYSETYGLRLNDSLGKRASNRSFHAYRFSVRSFLPRIANAETILHGRTMPPDADDDDFHTLEHMLHQSGLENNWANYPGDNGFGAHLLAALIFILPPIGPLADLKIKGPTADTEPLYVHSLILTEGTIRRLLQSIADNNVQATLADLPNRDLDTGLRSAPGTYRLCDLTYAKLLAEITKPGAPPVPAGLIADIQSFYRDWKPNSLKARQEKWSQIQANLAILATSPTIPEP
jgi:hypothetical protein